MKLLAAIVALFAGLSAGAFAQTKMKLTDLPPAVQKTVKDETRNAKIVGIAKEVENGKTVYELETKVNGHGRDLMIDANGVVLSVEEEVALDSIPAAAKAAIQKKAAGGKIAKVETLTKGKKVCYEAVVVSKGKSAEIAVNADESEAK
jgi:uncharacterized membrane protein YkoI